MSFFVTLQSNFQHVMLYEKPELQQKARNAIPHQQLSSAAERKLNEGRQADPGEVLRHLKTIYLHHSLMFLYHKFKKTNR